ncbi:solute carrier family 12 member 8-like [Liolophura sinensis]|uniref:solute carrier family 12 member 8-like n=1 Tax=Liolophura sinensis TaxID=3198878 RepID=UPI003158AB06
MTDSSDTESTVLMSATAKKEKKKPDWSRFGLNPEKQEAGSYQRDTTPSDHHLEGGYDQSDPGKGNELFHEDEHLSQKPWWKANFFISEPVLFGTWDGVFTSCMITILSVVIFLRMGWIVGNAGIGYSILVVLMSVSVALIAALSAIGVCERCRMESGGIYFLLSHVLGARIGGACGIIYCFAQAVSCSLAVMGFGESIMVLAGEDNPWIARGVAIGITLLLMGINVAGVKWVIRLQLLLLIALFLSTMDLIVGSFLHTVPEAGVTGYSLVNLRNNSGPDYLPGESFFSIFGLFFATVTGILAGINMSGDLADPFNNIPTGTLSALGVSTCLYLSFTIVLGATCTRASLQDDYNIAEKVSIVGVLWLAGLYISSVSSCMSSLYGPPRILQSIANENTIPIIKILGNGRGPNKVPVYALVVIFLIVILFILVGQVNTLAPIVTTAFMMTYAAIDYSYFALAMSYDKRQQRESRFYNGSQQASKQVATGQAALPNGKSSYGSTGHIPQETTHKDSFQKFATDLDKLFPERLHQRGHSLVRQGSAASPSEPTTPVSPDFDATKKRPSMDEFRDTSQLLDSSGEPVRKPNTDIIKMRSSWYSKFCNRWVSFLGTFICLVIMFSIQWMYALAEVTLFIVVYVYIGQASPGYFPGIAEFNLYEWVKGSLQSCCRRGPPPPEQVIVTPNTPAMSTMASQLTEDNEDFAERGRYHQSEVVRENDLVEYDDE